MRRTAFLFSICVASFFLPALRADDHAAQADRWIEQLGSGDFRTRESATQALTRLGPAALPALRRARVNGDPEVRKRLEELIPALENAETLAPKHVRLRLTQRPLRDALAEITRQTAYKLAVWPEPPPNDPREKLVYSFQMEDVTFWEALDRVCEAGGLVLQQGNFGDEGLRLQYEDTSVPFLHVTGPFRMVAQRFDYGRSLQLGSLPRSAFFPGQQGSEYLNFTLSLAVEPKLPILRVWPVRMIAALDDQNRSMLTDSALDRNTMFGGPRFYSGGGYKTYCQQAQVSLAWPSKASRSVRLLKGILPVTLLARQEPIVVTDKLSEAKGKKFHAGGKIFEVEDVAPTPAKQHQVKLVIEDENKAGGGDYSRVHSLYQRIEVQDAAGEKYHLFFNSIGSSGASTAQLTFTCDSLQNGKLGPPARLVYHAWTTMEHEVVFEFRDLPLP